MILNANTIVQHTIRFKKGIVKHVEHVNVNVKIIKCEKDYSWNPNTCI